VDPKIFLVVAVVLVMGWFAFGVIYNLRRGEAVLRWLQGGLPRIGERTTLRWLGTSVAELVIAKAHSPFRRLETLLVLTPRDVPWMWLLAWLQHRRDTLIFRAQLVDPPTVDLEWVDPSSWTGKLALNQAIKRDWQSQPYHGLQLMAPAGALGSAHSTLERTSASAQELALHYWRFSLRRDSPHLELHLAFPDHHRTDAAQFFDALRQLSLAVGESRS